MKLFVTLCRTSVILLVLMISSVTLPAQNGWRQNEMEIKVQINNHRDAQVLHSLKLNGDIYRDYALMFVTPDELKLVNEQGLDYEIQKENLNDFYKDFWEKDEAYHTYQQTIDLIDSLATALPNLCKKVIYGQSVQGRQLAALKISDNVTIDENEAEVGFDGNIHGDEIGGGENMIRLARYLCQKYGNDPLITNLVDNREIWILPIVNPDGRVNLTRYNANGIDLNRDAGYLWDGEGNSTGFYSQPESKALRLMDQENQFSIHLTNHSGTEVYLYPWFFRTDACPDYAAELALANLYESNSGYANLETGPGTSLYPTTGSTAESAYGCLGTHGIVIEISYDKQPPASELLYYFNINLPSMVKLIEYSGYGVEGTITDETTGEPVAATVFVGSTLPCYSDPEVGDFHKYVVPGTYNLTFKANGYQTKMVSNVVVSALSSTIADVQLTPENHQGIYRILASRIPNGNQSDEGATWNSIGQPDNMNYSLGKNGILVVDMQELVVDGAGNDLIVFEGDATPETFTLYGGSTMDGPWISLGAGTGTTEYDLGSTSLSEARFFKFVDDGDGSASVNDAGFDLDAMQSLSSITGVYILMEGFVVDDANGNNNGLLEPGETANFTITLKNIGSLDAMNVFGTLSCPDPFITISTTTPQEFGDILINGSATATFTVSADASVPAGHESTFTLDYTGDNGVSGSKFFTITFPDYCTATTSTEDEYISKVVCGEIDNSSGWQGGVANYTSIYVTIEPGESKPITITNGTPWASDITTVWVDWNRDFEFGDLANETFQLTNVGGSGASFTGTVSTPAGTSPGDYRMRIRMTYSTAPTPCGSASYGEIEDYTVKVGGAVLIPNFTANTNEICINNEVQFTDNSQGNITSWSWSFPGGTPATSTLQNPTISYAGAGNFDVSLTVSDGLTSQTLSQPDFITVFDLPLVTFAQIPDMCLNWPQQELTQGFPVGGVYSGTGVFNGWFSPGVAGVGTHLLTYVYADENGCENQATQTVYVDECTGIDGLSQNNAFNVYPNPSTGKVFITSANSSGNSFEVKLTTTLGKIIYQENHLCQSQNETFVLDVPNIKPGIYILTISGMQTLVIKLIIQ